MAKTSREIIYDIRKAAEKTDTIGKDSREKNALREKKIFSQKNILKKLFRKEFENIENFAAGGP